MKLCQITKNLKTNIIFLHIPVGPTQIHGYKQESKCIRNIYRFYLRNYFKRGILDGFLLTAML